MKIINEYDYVYYLNLQYWLPQVCIHITSPFTMHCSLCNERYDVSQKHANCAQK